MGMTTQKAEPVDEKKQLKDQMRLIERSGRKIDREIVKLQQAEKKHLKEVETLAKKGQHTAAKTVAETVAMTRN